MASHSRKKGREGERELADYLTKYGFPALRNEGNGAGGEDVSHSIAGVWLEVSRAEAVSFPAKYRQALKASKGKVPIVVHRYNRSPWMVYCTLDYVVSLWQAERYTPKEEA